MSDKKEQVPITTPPIDENNSCMCCPMMCGNSYMLRNEIMPNYDSEDFDDEESYRPGPGGGHGPGGNPGPGGGHGPGGNPGPGGNHGPDNWHKVWHGHGGYYGNKYYSDINYYYYLISRFYPYYPYDPYFDYYYNRY